MSLVWRGKKAGQRGLHPRFLPSLPSTRITNCSRPGCWRSNRKSCIFPALPPAVDYLSDYFSDYSLHTHPTQGLQCNIPARRFDYTCHGQIIGYHRCQVTQLSSTSPHFRTMSVMSPTISQTIPFILALHKNYDARSFMQQGKLYVSHNFLPLPALPNTVLSTIDSGLLSDYSLHTYLTQGS